MISGGGGMMQEDAMGSSEVRLHRIKPAVIKKGPLSRAFFVNVTIA
jgi:hypothetical protein